MPGASATSQPCPAPPMGHRNEANPSHAFENRNAGGETQPRGPVQLQKEVPPGLPNSGVGSLGRVCWRTQSLPSWVRGSSLLPLPLGPTPVGFTFLSTRIFQPKAPQVAWKLSGFPDALQAVAPVRVSILVIGPAGPP